MTEPTEPTEWPEDDLASRFNKGPPRAVRICAICWEDIPRPEYDEHMQREHGYTTLIINAENLILNAAD